MRMWVSCVRPVLVHTRVKCKIFSAQLLNCIVLWNLLCAVTWQLFSDASSIHSSCVIYYYDYFVPVFKRHCKNSQNQDHNKQLFFCYSRIPSRSICFSLRWSRDDVDWLSSCWSPCSICSPLHGVYSCKADSLLTANSICCWPRLLNLYEGLIKPTFGDLVSITLGHAYLFFI